MHLRGAAVPNRQGPIFGVTNGVGTRAPGHRITRPRGSTAGPRFVLEGVPLFEVVLELAAAGWVAQLAQRLGLDLADPLAGDVDLLAHLLEGPGTPVLEAEAELEHASLTTGQRVEHRLDLLLEELVRRRFGGSQRPPILDEVAE